MECYTYRIRKDELVNRRRLSKNYLREGDIVAYGIVDKKKGPWDEYDSYYKIGLCIIGHDDVIPKYYHLYQATDAEKAWVRTEEVRRVYAVDFALSGESLVPYLIGKIENHAKWDYGIQELLFSMPYLIEDDYAPYFKDDVWASCKDKIGAIGLNFNKEKTALYTLLIAESMIMGSGRSREECMELSSLLNRKWDLFKIIYSFFYGRNISTDHSRFTELVAYLVGREYYSKYLKLIVIAMGNPNQKIEKILRYSPAENCGKLKDKLSKLLLQKDLIEQSTDLDELFQILFPSTLRKHLENDSPHSSIEEMQEQIRESQALKDMLRKIEEYAHLLQSELDDAIKMNELTSAFMRCDPSTARAIFAQLDMVLEGNNEVWDKHRVQLKKTVNMRYEEAMQMIGDTNQQAKLAVGYAQKAASQPRLIQISNSDVKCDFNAPVGQVMGNVEHMLSRTGG